MKNVLFKSAWTDVIFEGRNKLYGAYVLRQEQEKNTIAALFIMVGSFAFLFCGFKGLQAAGFFKSVPIVKVMCPNTFFDYEYPAEVYEAMKSKQAVVETPAKATATDNSFSTTPVSDAPVKSSDNAPFAPSIDAGPLTPTVDGGSTGPAVEGPSRADGPTGNIPVIESAPDVSGFAEVMPVFPGDLNLFLASNIHYPAAALNSDKEGKLLVEIILNEQGKVIAARVIKPLGFGLDEEALRVVNMMPAWSPAKMGTKPVKVRLVIPIKFKLG